MPSPAGVLRKVQLIRRLRRRRVYSSDEVADHFRRETGHELRVTDTVRDLQHLGVGDCDILDPMGRPDEYGDFDLCVFADPAELRRGLRGFPDGRGIYWHEQEIERGPDAGSISVAAVKPYGANVRLAWRPENGTTRTDDRYERLEAILEPLNSELAP